MRFSHPFNAAMVFAGLGLTALAAAPVAAQGLNGQPVNVTVRFPDISTVRSNDGTQIVTPTGVTFSDISGSGMTIFVLPNQIRFTANPNGVGFGSTNFSGFAVSETGGSRAKITGFSIDPATTVTGFDNSRVSFDATDIFANFQGLQFTANQNVTLDIVAAPVPEASTRVSLSLLLALGLGGLVVARKRRGKA